jgi:hypothetical protein
VDSGRANREESLNTYLPKRGGGFRRPPVRLVYLVGDGPIHLQPLVAMIRLERGVRWRENVGRRRRIRGYCSTRNASPGQQLACDARRPMNR